MSEHRGNSRAKRATHTMLEVLPNIIAYSCPSDLRRSRFVNHKFYTLFEAYRAQSSKGLTALPNEIILETIQYLSAQGRSRLARVSHDSNKTMSLRKSSLIYAEANLCCATAHRLRLQLHCLLTTASLCQ